MIGKSTPSPGNLRAVAKELDVSIDELLGVAAGQEPPFESWRAFLVTAEAQGLTEDERMHLQSLYFPGARRPTVMTYMLSLAAYRSSVTE